MGSFTFNRQFQVKILALLCQDYDFLVFGQDLLEPSYFTNKVYSNIFIIIRNYFQDYQQIVDETVLRQEFIKGIRRRLIKETEVKIYADTFKELFKRVPSQDYVKTEVIKFCRYQAIKNAILESPRYLEVDDFEHVEGMLKDAFNVGMTMTDIGMQFFNEYQLRSRRRMSRIETKIFPTGIPQLDHYLGGGLKCKQLGIWMAPSNKGKSIALAHCGKRTVVSRRNVIHYTLEMSQDEVADRYDASFSSISTWDLVDQYHDVETALDKCLNLYGNSLIIKEFPSGIATVDTLRSHLLKLQQINFFPDLIIVDYLDLLRPKVRRENRRHELSEITTDLRGLAVLLDIPIWSATQSNRSAISLETHTEEQVAEDYGKIGIADIIITINQTRKEVFDEIMRLFLAKNRNGPRYREIEIKTALKRMCFYDPFHSPAAGPDKKPPSTEKMKLQTKRRTKKDDLDAAA